MESALKGLKQNKIKIHLMDSALMYATESAIEDYSEHLTQNYPDVAELGQLKSSGEIEDITIDDRIGDFRMPSGFQMDGGAW